MSEEGGYTMVEMLVVIVILTVVLGGLVTLFVSGITAESDQNRRFQSQESVRNAMDKLRHDVHKACAVSNPTTYNVTEPSLTLYYSSDSCAAGTSTVSWCTSGSGTNYSLYREQAATCATLTHRWATRLASNAVFLYVPPNSHVTTLGSGTAGIATQDAGYALPRVHVDMQVSASASKTHEAFRAVDDVAIKNHARSCTAGTAAC